MLAFLMSNVLESARAGGIPPDQLEVIGASKLGDWANFWNKHGSPPAGYDALQALPQSIQKQIAAGFELRAKKPSSGSTNSIVYSNGCNLPSSHRKEEGRRKKFQIW
jgi:hypothetical protein